MIRLSRMADYGVVTLTHIAFRPGEIRTTAEVASALHLPVPTVSKVLKLLAGGGILVSHRGTKGGYALARRAEEISMADIIAAVEGPIALTECMTATVGGCDIESLCPSRTNWTRINNAIREALDGVTLADMIVPPDSFFPSPRSAQEPVANFSGGAG